MSSDKIILHYFPIRGRGEPIRLLLEDIGLSYTDNLITSQQWWSGTMKQEWIASGKAPFGQLPILQVGDNYMPQMEPVLRYFASQHGYYGETPQQKYQCDMVAAGCEDWRAVYVAWIYESPNFEADKPGYLENAHRFAGLFTNILKKVEGGAHYFTGTKIAFCDFLMWELLDLQLRVESTFLDKYPELKGFYDRVAARDKIVKYLASGRRPKEANNNGKG